ncbi:MAG: alpha/beta hydrolase [Firmicutes bacterium]|nr:alpha/beta hydrolase [Bacillota bacterium]MCM1401942.1 alpha/beta hydrolase [Bacteroides sp.]MCM1477849.1 alpha/beta hydrolase [Bacteroides sp.]
MTSNIEIKGVKLNYTRSGSGQPIVLMHGWGCNNSTLASIAAVAEGHCEVFNVDFPGFGDSPEPTDVWGVEQYTELIEEFVSKLGIENPILLGHSFGGRVGILYASRNPVRKLILVDAAGVKPKRSLRYYLKVYSFKTSKHLTKLLFGAEKAEKIIEAKRKKRASADYAAASPRMRAILSKVVNEDLKHVMPLIKAPTLLIWGENDTATPLSDAKTMEKLIPDAGLVSFPGCGHYSFLDNPHQFAAVLNSFLTA